MIITIAMMAGGCIVSDRDVSQDERFLVGYRPGQVYQLVQPVDVLEVGENLFVLIPLGAKRDYGTPAGTLPIGTRIRIVSLRHTVWAAPIQGETQVAAEAQLVDRPERTVSLQEISGVRWIDGDVGVRAPVLLPDPRWVELVPPSRSK